MKSSTSKTGLKLTGLTIYSEQNTMFVDQVFVKLVKETSPFLTRFLTFRLLL